MDDDILEIGDDGAFEIKSTQPVKQAPVPEVNYEIARDYIEEEDEATFQAKEKIVDTLSPGAFKVFQSGKCIHILIKLSSEDETVERVGYESQQCFVCTSTGKKYSVNLAKADPIDPKSGKCTIWKDYVTLVYSIVF
jgi:hypothetical protein